MKTFCWFIASVLIGLIYIEQISTEPAFPSVGDKNKKFHYLYVLIAFPINSVMTSFYDVQTTSLRLLKNK